MLTAAPPRHPLLLLPLPLQFQAVPPDWALREAEEEEDEATLRAG